METLKTYTKNTDEEAIAAELRALYLRNEKLTPQIVLEAAKDAASPLHSVFCWDDTIAAQKWREHQARKLIVSVRIECDDKPPERVYVRIASRPSEYKVLADVTVEEAEALLSEAARTLQAWIARYRELKDRLPNAYKQAQQLLAEITDAQ